MFVQALCHQPVWALCKHRGCQGFRFYQRGNMQSDRPLVSIRNRGSYSASPCLILCFVPSVALTYCTSVRMYTKAVVCSLLSLFHPQRGFVRGTESLTEGRRRAAERKVSKSHSSKTFKNHSGFTFGQRRFVCLFVCWFTSVLISSAATQPELWWCWQASRVMQGHSEADGRRQPPFTSPRTFPLTAKESASSVLFCC